MPAPKRPVAPDPVAAKYANATYFDPDAWRQGRVRSFERATVVPPLDDPPLALRDMVNMPWACDPGSDETLVALASMAKLSVGELCYKRNAFKPEGDRHAQCPLIVPAGRRRCQMCPLWGEDDDLPF